MNIVKSYAFPHPPLAIPEVGKSQEKEIPKTIAAFYETAEEISKVSPETIVIITPHNINYSDYFHISPGKSAVGDFSGFGVPKVKFEVQYDEEFSNQLIKVANNIDLPVGYLGKKYNRLDHGVMVPLYFINKKFRNYKIVRISQSGLDTASHYSLGMCIKETAELLNRKVVVIASGDLSHKLPNSPYGTVKEGIEFDSSIVSILKKGDFDELFTFDNDLREKAAECGFNSFVVLAGCFDGYETETDFYSYENTFGVGYAILSFTPVNKDVHRYFLEKYLKDEEEMIKSLHNTTDEYCSLAIKSLESIVKYGKIITLPNNLSDDLLLKKAGVFVTLHKGNSLRGCIGTIYPTTDSIAMEIIQNAISAGLNDPRFESVNKDELKYIRYSVDVLSEPEIITDISQLDVKRYGVILSYKNKRGLLLPDLDGINDVETQLSIAKQKAGISDEVAVTIERFEVTRHV